VVPGFGLGEHGIRTEALGDHTAELDHTGTLRFRTAGGKALKSVPAAVKRDHGERLAELKQAAKDVKAMAGAQRLRLERLLLGERTWTGADFRERYLDHALVGPLARRLIWAIDDRSALSRDGAFVDASGAAVPMATARRSGSGIPSTPSPRTSTRGGASSRTRRSPSRSSRRTARSICSPTRSARRGRTRTASPPTCCASTRWPR
jgi:Domain of unknown function (DUF4132)